MADVRDDWHFPSNDLRKRNTLGTTLATLSLKLNFK